MMNPNEAASQGLPEEGMSAPNLSHLGYSMNDSEREGKPQIEHMTDVVSHTAVPIVGGHDRDSLDSVNGGGGTPLLPAKRSAPDSPEDSDDSDDDDDDDGDGKKNPDKKRKKKAGGSGRRRIEIKFIENKSRRQVTFSRRKRGLMKKAYELTTLTGTQALVLIASETGHVYTFATPKLQPVVTLREGKELIQSCLNAPDTSYGPSSSDYIPQQQQQQQSPPQQHVQSHHIQKQDPHPHLPSTSTLSSSSGASSAGMVGGQTHHPHHDPHLQMYSMPPPHLQGPPHGYPGAQPSTAHMRYGEGMGVGGYVPGGHPHSGHSLPPMGLSGGGVSHMGSQMTAPQLIPKRDTSVPMSHEDLPRSQYSSHSHSGM